MTDHVRIGSWPIHPMWFVEVPFGAELLEATMRNHHAVVFGIYDDRQVMRERVKLVLLYDGEPVPDGVWDHASKNYLGIVQGIGPVLVFEFGRERIPE